MTGPEKRPRQKKEVRRHVSLMRQVARQVMTNRDPNDARPVPSPPWWSTVFSSRYKTEMCHHLEEQGFCSFGAGCVYAHSAAELRPLQRHPKHRSQLCKDFHEEGFCSFGGRCSFIHTKRETADIVSDVLNNMRMAPPMPENPVTAAASASSSTGGSRSSTPASWSSCDQGDNAQSSVADTSGGGGETAAAAALGDDSPPPTKKRKRRAQGKKNASLDPRWNPGTWKRDESDLPPLALEPSLLDAPLEPDFRRRWTYRWRDMPYRRLDVFEQLCPRDG
ncbi:uncharacterized protein [Dermacentor andersoni]|uniref:uncharacterized protein n=1 Tax=Dermacentor andersoni TaxID=34620 RepID=UPI0021558854|nr:mRNA decay activator protein ZFP36L2-A-like [Dermacentor andersoni]